MIKYFIGKIGGILIKKLKVILLFLVVAAISLFAYNNSLKVSFSVKDLNNDLEIRYSEYKKINDYTYVKYTNKDIEEVLLAISNESENPLSIKVNSRREMNIKFIEDNSSLMRLKKITIDEGRVRKLIINENQIK